jgi:hypothetical protein
MFELDQTARSTYMRSKDADDGLVSDIGADDDSLLDDDEEEKEDDEEEKELLDDAEEEPAQ